ncbi:MAG: phosphoribosylformylglycinamidine synthase, partial [Oscillospiraceae bacterium]
MVYRVYTEKKPPFATEAEALRQELVSLLGIQGLAGLRIVNRYDIEGISEELLHRCIPLVFSEPPVDQVYHALPAADAVFAVEYLPGQFDQRAESAAECVQLVSQGERPVVRSAKVYLLEGTLAPGQLAEIKKYLINPVEARQANLAEKQTLAAHYPPPEEVPVIEGFLALPESGLCAFIEQYGLAMDADDLAFCRGYFETEGRNPTLTELRMIDTYWSDHCRH